MNEIRTLNNPTPKTP